MPLSELITSLGILKDFDVACSEKKKKKKKKKKIFIKKFKKKKKKKKKKRFLSRKLKKQCPSFWLVNF